MISNYLLRVLSPGKPSNQNDGVILVKNTKLKPLNKEFDPELVSVLIKEQENLTALLAKIVKKFKKGMNTEATRLLVVFSNKYVEHVTKKQARLYTFLGSTFKGNEIVSDHILGQRKDMNFINSEVRHFLNYWMPKDISTAGPEFELEVTTVSQLLKARNTDELKEVFEYYEGHHELLEQGNKHPVIRNLVRLKEFQSDEDSDTGMSELHLSIDSTDDYQLKEA